MLSETFTSIGNIKLAGILLCLTQDWYVLISVVISIVILVEISVNISVEMLILLWYYFVSCNISEISDEISFVI